MKAGRAVTNPKMAPSELSPLLVDAAGVGRLLGYSRSMVFQLHSRGRIPRPLRLSADPRWSTTELSEWLAAGAPPRETWEASKSRR